MTWTSGAWLQARTARQISRRTMTWLGLAILAVSYGLTAAALFPQTTVVLGVVAWGAAGLGMGLAYTTLSLSMLELVTPGQEGDASASLQLASVLGAGLGAGLGGALIALMQTQGEPLARALLLQDLLMIGVIALAFAAARGLPGRG